MNIPVSPPRFQVTLSDGRPTVIPQSAIRNPQSSRVRNPAKLIPVGSVCVQIFGRAPGPFTIAWRESAGGKRHRAMRSTYAKAKAFAEKIGTNLANGQVAMNEFTEADRASYRRGLELLAPTGKPLEVALGEYTESVQKLAGVSLQEAVQFFLDNRPRGYVPRPLPALVDIFLAEKDGEISKGWHSHLSHNLRQLAGKFATPLHALQASDLNAWLRGLDVGPRARHNYRSAVDQLVRWAQANNHLPRSWSEMEHVADPGHKLSEIKILTPEQMTALLAARQHAEEEGKAQATFVPFLALQAFAGIRHEEMNGEKAMLDWRDIHLQERYLYVPKDVAKTGRDRTVPISDNLAAWLQPYLKRNGPITTLAQTSGALTKAKKAARIPAGDNQTRNVLRKSFISYRKALVKNMAQVAEEAGNSVGIIRKHYGRIIPEAEAQRWFNIWPTAADVTQLNFAGL